MFFLSVLLLIALLAAFVVAARHPRGPAADDVDALDDAALRELGLAHRERAHWPSPSSEHLFH